MSTEPSTLPSEPPGGGAGMDGGEGADEGGGKTPAAGGAPGADANKGPVTSRQVEGLRDLANRPGATQEDVRNWAMANAQLTGRDPDDIMREYYRKHAYENSRAVDADYARRIREAERAGNTDRANELRNQRQQFRQQWNQAVKGSDASRDSAFQAVQGGASAWEAQTPKVEKQIAQDQMMRDPEYWKAQAQNLRGALGSKHGATNEGADEGGGGDSEPPPSNIEIDNTAPIIRPRIPSGREIWDGTRPIDWTTLPPSAPEGGPGDAGGEGADEGEGGSGGSEGADEDDGGHKPSEEDLRRFVEEERRRLKKSMEWAWERVIGKPPKFGISLPSPEPPAGGAGMDGGDPDATGPVSPPPHPVNQPWGDYFYVNPAMSFAQGETLVHMEATPPATSGEFSLSVDHTMPYFRYGALGIMRVGEPPPEPPDEPPTSGAGADGGGEFPFPDGTVRSASATAHVSSQEAASKASRAVEASPKASQEAEEAKQKAEEARRKVEEAEEAARHAKTPEEIDEAKRKTSEAWDALEEAEKAHREAIGATSGVEGDLRQAKYDAKHAQDESERARRAANQTGDEDLKDRAEEAKRESDIAANDVERAEDLAKPNLDQARDKTKEADDLNQETRGALGTVDKEVWQKAQGAHGTPYLQWNGEHFSPLRPPLSAPADGDAGAGAGGGGEAAGAGGTSPPTPSDKAPDLGPLFRGQQGPSTIFPDSPPYPGNWIMNRSDVPVEVRFIDEYGNETTIPEFGPGLSTGVPLRTKQISVHPLKDGNFGVEIQNSEFKTIETVNTPGTFTNPMAVPQPVTEGEPTPASHPPILERDLGVDLFFGSGLGTLLPPAGFQPVEGGAAPNFGLPVTTNPALDPQLDTGSAALDGLGLAPVVPLGAGNPGGGQGGGGGGGVPPPNPGHGVLHNNFHAQQQADLDALLNNQNAAHAASHAQQAVALAAFQGGLTTAHGDLHTQQTNDHTLFHNLFPPENPLFAAQHGQFHALQGQAHGDLHAQQAADLNAFQAGQQADENAHHAQQNADLAALQGQQDAAHTDFHNANPGI